MRQLHYPPSLYQALLFAQEGKEMSLWSFSGVGVLISLRQLCFRVLPPTDNGFAFKNMLLFYVPELNHKILLDYFLPHITLRVTNFDSQIKHSLY